MAPASSALLRILEGTEAFDETHSQVANPVAQVARRENALWVILAFFSLDDLPIRGLEVYDFGRPGVI